MTVPQNPPILGRFCIILPGFFIILPSRHRLSAAAFVAAEKERQKKSMVRNNWSCRCLSLIACSMHNRLSTRDAETPEKRKKRRSLNCQSHILAAHILLSFVPSFLFFLFLLLFFLFLLFSAVVVVFEKSNKKIKTRKEEKKRQA